MPRIHQQAKTVFAPLRYIVAAGLSVAFATSALAQVTQPRQTEPTRSEITPRARTNEKIDAKACVDADVERYVLDLGTPKLTNDEFEALVKCGAQAVPVLSQALKSDSTGVRASAAYALAKIGSEADQAVPLLITTIKDKNEAVRISSAYALGQIGSNTAHSNLELANRIVPVLVESFQDSSSSVRSTVVCALGYIGSSQVIQTLIAGLKDEERDVRNSATYALGYLVTGYKSIDKSFDASQVNLLLRDIVKKEKIDGFSRYYAAQALKESNSDRDSISLLNFLTKSRKIYAIETYIHPTSFRANKIFFFNKKMIAAPNLYYINAGTRRQENSDSPSIICLLPGAQSILLEYVERLDKPELKSSEFEVIVQCSSSILNALKAKLRSGNRDTRASAAYALGEISVRHNSKSIIGILHEFVETDPDVLQIINSYSVVRKECDYNPFDNHVVGCLLGSQVSKLVQAQTRASSPIICSLPGIRTIFPRCK